MTTAAIISYFMLFFALIGAADRAIGCRFGPGKAFEKGFSAVGTLMLAMIGPFALAPLIAKYLAPALSPLCSRIGIDPSIIAGLFIANDSGGWPLALALAEDEAVGRLSGSVMGSTMGCAVMFAFPMTFALCPKEKKPLAAKGLAIGLSTVPVACFVSGLLFGIPLPALFSNLLPLIVFAAFFVVGLCFFERATVKIVTAFGVLLTAVLTAALAAAMVVKATGIEIPDFGSFDEAMEIIGGIAVFLCGAFTLLWFLERFAGRLFAKIGRAAGMDEVSVMGILTSAVNAIPMFGMLGDMNDRGVVVNAAFLVPASFLLGDHLAFQLTADPTTAVPLIVGKLAGGIAAVALAMGMTKSGKDGGKRSAA